MPKQYNNWAKFIGSGLAHVQDGIDVAADICFRTLKKSGGKKFPKQKKGESNYWYATKKFGLGVCEFLGTMGDEYYKKYEELKKSEKTETTTE